MTEFLFRFAWALFIVFEKITMRLPWPFKIFLLSLFANEFQAQLQLLRRHNPVASPNLDETIADYAV